MSVRREGDVFVPQRCEIFIRIILVATVGRDLFANDGVQKTGVRRQLRMADLG